MSEENRAVLEANRQVPAEGRGGDGEPLRQPRILVLEDEESVQKLVEEMMRIRGLACDAAGCIADARAMMGRVRYDILLVDVNLPDGSGLSLADDQDRDAPLVVVITGSDDIRVAVHAIQTGAIDFITKPFAVGDFLRRIDRVVDEWRSRERIQHHARVLETLVRMKGEELSRTAQQVDEVHDMAVAGLVSALNLKDHETADHCARVSENCTVMGSLLGLSPFECRNLRWGAYLHDVGKIGVPEHILLKQEKLSPEEKRVMAQHPCMGFAMVRNIEFLRFATDVVLSHHERFDGEGYPEGLARYTIPLNARIFSVMDALDAMTADRPYRRASPIAIAVRELADKAGSQFDPEIVEIFVGAPLSSWRVQRWAARHT